jgi:hypothetical protein
LGAHHRIAQLGRQLLESFESQAVAAALARVALDRARQEELRAMGRARAQAFFDERPYVDILRRLWQSDEPRN